MSVDETSIDFAIQNPWTERTIRQATVRIAKMVDEDVCLATIVTEARRIQDRFPEMSDGDRAGLCLRGGRTACKAGRFCQEGGRSGMSRPNKLPRGGTHVDQETGGFREIPSGRFPWSNGGPPRGLQRQRRERHTGSGVPPGPQARGPRDHGPVRRRGGLPGPSGVPAVPTGHPWRSGSP